MIRLRSIVIKIFIFCGFILFGLVLGYLSIWFDRQYDQWFPLNIPGNFLYEFMGNHIMASVVAWMALGLAITLVFKPKIIAWIMGIYLVIFGGLWLAWEGLHL